MLMPQIQYTEIFLLRSAQLLTYVKNVENNDLFNIILIINEKNNILLISTKNRILRFLIYLKYGTNIEK